MPILWGDRLVGRFDPKLDRTTNTLVINGLWLEDPALAKDEAFGEALAGDGALRAVPRRPQARRRGRAPAGTPPAALPSSRCTDRKRASGTYTPRDPAATAVAIPKSQPRTRPRDDVPAAADA